MNGPGLTVYCIIVTDTWQQDLPSKLWGFHLESQM